MNSALVMKSCIFPKREFFTTVSHSIDRRLRRPSRNTFWTLHASGAIQAESEITETERFAFDVAVQVIPHPNKIDYGGEDAYFVSGKTCFGVADGVGGWAEGGINPAAYSRKIMTLTQEGLSQNEEENGLKLALDSAHQQTKLPGSCTACLVRVDPANGTLEGLNLGDSGFVILRQNEMVLRTQPQQHFFDCPKQLADFPGHCEATDYASDGQACTFSLNEKDLIVMATDGFWDNVFDGQILEFTSDQYGSRKTVEELAEGLARLAQRNSLDEETASPYSIAALEEGYDVPWYEKVWKTRIRDGKVKVGTLTGGKLDDITVIVAKVKKELIPPPTPTPTDAPVEASP